jgi:hypothetical protein
VASESSLPYSEDLAIGTYHEPDESDFKMHFNIILRFKLKSSDGLLFFGHLNQNFLLIIMSLCALFCLPNFVFLYFIIPAMSGEG